MRHTRYDRSWHELKWLDRSLRITVLAGTACWLWFWLTEVWLQSAAFHQPRSATGLYQHPYHWKGQVSFITDQQARADYIAHMLAIGWLVAAIAGGWSLLRDRHAAQQRTQSALRNDRPQDAA